MRCLSPFLNDARVHVPQKSSGIGKVGPWRLPGAMGLCRMISFPRLCTTTPSDSNRLRALARGIVFGRGPGMSLGA